MSPNDKKSMTSSVGVREWIEATKGWNFGWSPTNQLPKLTEGLSSVEQGSTKEKCEEALKRASRKIKK